MAIYHNKIVKEHSYRPLDTVSLSRKLIKTKRNYKVKQKYLGPFKILAAVGKKAFKLNLLSKKCIHLLIQVSLLERDFKRKETVDQKTTDQFKFAERQLQKKEVNSIIGGIVFVEEAKDTRSLWLYYLIQWTGVMRTEDTFQPVKRIAHLQRKLKICHAKNLHNLITTSLLNDEGALLPSIVA